MAKTPYSTKQVKLVFATSMLLWLPLALFLILYADKLSSREITITTLIALPVLVILLFLISEKAIRKIK